MKKKEKKGLIYHKEKGLTNTEKEILHLLTDEFFTVKQISSRRKVSLQAVYKIIKKLKEKGAFDGGLNKVEKIQPTHNKADIRLHGQEFNIKILYQDNKYQELLEKSNILFIGGNTIRLYKNSIEIYSGQSFFGKDVNESEKKSLEYWNRFFARLEHDLKVNLIKTRSRNIKIVNQHYARGDSEICNNARDENERIWIYAEEDGKLAFITDDSFGFREDETVHSKTAKPDRKAIDKQINDWRLNNPPTNSKIWEIAKVNTLNQQKTIQSINSLINHQKDMPRVLNRLEQQISSHLKLIQEYRKENVRWRKGKVKEIRKEFKLGKQTTLNDFQ